MGHAVEDQEGVRQKKEGIGQVQETWSQDMLDPAARGKFLGIINITISLSKMPGGIIGALFADVFGIWTIYLVGAAFLAAAIPMYHRVPDMLNSTMGIEKRP